MNADQTMLWLIALASIIGLLGLIAKTLEGIRSVLLLLLAAQVDSEKTISATRIDACVEQAERSTRQGPVKSTRAKEFLKHLAPLVT